MTRRYGGGGGGALNLFSLAKATWSTETGVAGGRSMEDTPGSAVEDRKEGLDNCSHALSVCEVGRESRQSPNKMEPLTSRESLR